MTQRLNRKQFLAGLSALGAGAALAGSGRRGAVAAERSAPFGATEEAADFVVAARYADLPPDLIALGKKHILDAIGLAIAGEQAEIRTDRAALPRRSRRPRRACRRSSAPACVPARASPPSPTASPSTPTISTTPSSPSPRTGSTAC